MRFTPRLSLFLRSIARRWAGALCGGLGTLGPVCVRLSRINALSDSAVEGETFGADL